MKPMQIQKLHFVQSKCRTDARKRSSLPVVYEELRRLASQRLANEKPGQTLQATALVHEAFLRLVDQHDQQKWDNSRHFFAAAAEAMRRILIERARQRASLKRGGDRERIEFDHVDPAVLPLACDDILGLDEALQKLERLHPRKAELVKLRFFAVPHRQAIACENFRNETRPEFSLRP
jgi:RNA polymerase sigma factor (TIGR02999 family)